MNRLKLLSSFARQKQTDPGSFTATALSPLPRGFVGLWDACGRALGLQRNPHYWCSPVDAGDNRRAPPLRPALRHGLRTPMQIDTVLALDLGGQGDLPLCWHITKSLADESLLHG